MDTNTFAHRGSSLPRRFWGVNWALFFATVAQVGVLLTILFILTPRLAAQSPPAADGTRCVILEFYYRGSNPQSLSLLKESYSFLQSRRGVGFTAYDLDRGEGQDRFEAIARYYRLTDAHLPLLYGCNQQWSGIRDAAALRSYLNSMLTISVYTRPGCPHCAAGKRFIADIQRRYPAFNVQIYDITGDAAARNRLQELARHYKTAAASVPVFHFCNQLHVGYDSDATSGRRIESILSPWTYACTVKRTSYLRSSWQQFGDRLGAAAWLAATSSGYEGLAPLQTGLILASRQDGNVPPPLPVPGGEPAPLPALPPEVGRSPPEAAPLPLPLPSPPGDGPPPLSVDGGSSENSPEAESMDLPLFGRVSASELGLPLFTIAVGLVDGFNPCAMWVLLFLLSVLVNLRDRGKILAVAGTFVVISGVAYFAFMAAWLNVFLLVGVLRPVQIVLGLLATFIGAIHIKDFFAFHRGISLSIPESAKPGIYARVRRIVTAENLWAAIAGAIVLAVLVNIIELLCTAGLPAVYTQILSMHQLSPWQNYAYLALYIVAYMLDDSVMVGIVVVTLGRRKMQETHGRWLKLVSGVLVLALGILLLLKPEWLL